MSADAPEEDAPRPAEGDDDGEPKASPDAAPASDAAAARAARRKRKKKHVEAPSVAATEAERSDDEAPSDDEDEPDERPRRRDGIPAFALNFPEEPALQVLVAAFEQGDYARVRREAPALVKTTDRAEVRRAARELLRRLDPDPMAVYLLAGAALLLAFLALWYWTHPHAAP